MEGRLELSHSDGDGGVSIESGMAMKGGGGGQGYKQTDSVHQEHAEDGETAMRSR